jgi:hypothetical protein
VIRDLMVSPSLRPQRQDSGNQYPLAFTQRSNVEHYRYAANSWIPLSELEELGMIAGDTSVLKYFREIIERIISLVLKMFMLIL